MIDCKYAFLLACGLLWSFSVRADLNIALIAPTDGDFKYFSEELVNGAKVAVDEINESGGLLGKKINLIQIDDPCDDTLSLTTAQMMAVNRSQEDKMHVVLGPHCSNQAEKVADIFAAAEIFQILPIGGSPAVYKKNYRSLIEFVGSPEQQAADFFRYYTETYPGRRLAVAYNGQYPEMLAVAKEIQHLFTKAGQGSRLKAFDTGEFNGNARRIAQTVKAGNAEILFMLDRAEPTMETVRQLKADNPGFVIFTNRYFSSRKFARKLGSVAEGTYLLSLPPLQGNPNFAEDLVRLRLWGIEPEGLMAYGYLSVKLWGRTVNQAQSFAPAKLARSLNKKLVQTGWGNVVYTDGIPDRSLKYAIYRFENGEYAQVY